MATLSRGQTFGSTETVTNTKLHNLVDLGSVTNIVDADCSPSMNLADTKLADITTGSKVRGTALGNLASIPSGAGVIPIANLPILGSTMVSLVSIANSSLLPLTLTSWVDGAAMRNIQSMPSLAGQLAWYSIVSSLASGGSIRFNGTNKFIGSISSDNPYSSGTTLIQSADTSRAVSTLTYTKSKEIFLIRPGTLTIKFTLTLLPGSVASIKGQIYKNGIAVGTERTLASISTVEYSEDISGWNVGDYCQIYVKISNVSDSGNLTNFRIYSNTPSIETVTTDTAV